MATRADYSPLKNCVSCLVTPSYPSAKEKKMRNGTVTADVSFTITAGLTLDVSGVQSKEEAISDFVSQIESDPEYALKYADVTYVIFEGYECAEVEFDKVEYRVKASVIVLSDSEEEAKEAVESMLQSSDDYSIDSVDEVDG